MAIAPETPPLPVREPALGTNNFNGLLYMLAAAAVVSAMHVLVRDLAQEIEPFVIVFFRCVVVLIVLTPFLLRQDRSAWKSKRPGLQLARGVVGLGAMLTWFYALSVVPVGDATALSFTAVLFASLGAVFILGEAMGPRRWGALLVGFVGTAIILRPGFQEISFGYLVVLASTVMWAGALLIVKVLSRDDSPVTIVFYSSVYFTPTSFIVALFYWQWPTWEQLAWMIVVGVLAAVAHLCMAKAMQQGDASAVMPADFTRLVWAAGLGYLAFGEFPDLWTWVGGIVIFLATLYITYREARLNRQARRTAGHTSEG